MHWPKATIYAEIVGRANSDGHDMVAPSGEGAVRAWNWRWPALTARPLPTKLTCQCPRHSTPVGDVKELDAVREVFARAAICRP